MRVRLYDAAWAYERQRLLGPRIAGWLAPAPSPPWKHQATMRILSPMNEPKAAAPVPAGWRESLERSKAQIAAGESVPLLPALDRLRATAERIEAEQGVTADGERTTPRR